MLKVDSIVKKFGSKTVLNGINLSVKQGEVVTLIGPSGTGKTTLLRSINLLERADEGSVSIEDLTVTNATKDKKKILDLRRKTAMVFQQYNLFKNLKVIDNIIQPQVVVKGVDKETARRRAIELLHQVGLSDFADYYPVQLSGGQQQRVSIARALGLDPEVILFDEPTSALDPELSKEVLNVIKQVADTGISIILATHEMQFAEEISDQVIFMEKGNIVEQGSPRAIFHNAQNERTREFLKNYQQYVSSDEKKVEVDKFEEVERLKVI
ncbi:amino acid ABC transporter ATP-binding protein [Paucilactobacillus suebicus]|uniref:Sulfur-containing amino acid ABC transporter ATP-binding protein TcyN n=1 Tax=Paucilactobacillus suebicus DSM 5007 = KCTC 3549 TaxID=1423807 RepID=A0A0R1VX84_9LACO|nr:amino acid ABC transporter ATP-binding protein [Paucilactobacillus suebicus]KRM10302.1 sulfur-containing amino acid ABC transporter ATP-binding protein TcyN [Paucilactobacillus suebicus DSM 5007 = KCTC 3549]